MNPMERQLQLGRELMELNAEWFRKLTEMDTENFSKYVELNQEFASKLPEVKDLQGFMDLQRDYGEQLWNGTQEAMQARGKLMQDAVDANGEAFRKAFSSETEVEAPKAKAAKSTTKAA